MIWHFTMHSFPKNNNFHKKRITAMFIQIIFQILPHLYMFKEKVLERSKTVNRNYSCKADPKGSFDISSISLLKIKVTLNRFKTLSLWVKCHLQRAGQHITTNYRSKKKLKHLLMTVFFKQWKPSTCLQMYHYTNDCQDKKDKI